MIYQIIALLIWSSSFTVAKATHAMLDLVLLVQFRLLLAAIIVLPSGLKLMRHIPREKWKPLIIAAIMNYNFVLLLQFIGLRYTSAASAVTMTGLEPLIMVFVGHFFFNDRARKYQVICGLIALIGVMLLILGGAEESGEVSFLGCALILAGGFGFAFMYRPTQKLITEIGVQAYTSLSMLISAVTFVPFLLLANSFVIHWNWSGIMALLYLGLCCSWLAYFLWNKGMSSVSANLSGLLLTLEPILGVSLSVIFLNEKISLVSALGIFLIIFATISAVIFPKVFKK